MSSLNVPRRYEIPVAILRALSCVPATLNIFYNLKASCQIPSRDAGGPLTIQTTQLEYYVAILWVKKKLLFYCYYVFLC